MPVKPHFLLLGEPLALDLVNTRIRRDGFAVDLLDSPAALTAWLHAQHGRIRWQGGTQADDAVAICSLRDAIDALLRARRARTRPQPAAVDQLNRILATINAHPKLVWSAHGPSLQTTRMGSQRHAVLRALAADALSLLTGPMAEHVRECAHPDCRLQFVAVNPRRRWCSPATCGNRARVAEHYRRHHVTN